jgi:uncharacterized protein (TIGR02118 family)
MAAIKVSVLYPAGEGKRFDHGYYATTHMPMAGWLLQPTRYEIDRGIGGGTPGSAAPYVAGCHFYFSSLDDFQRAITSHGAELQADFPNYTDIAPIIQVSEVTGP